MRTRTALISAADLYMGPAIAEKFTSLGSNIVRGRSSQVSQSDIEHLVKAAGMELARSNIQVNATT